MQNVDNIIIVGAMANNFLAHKGLEIGNSLIEKNSKKIIENVYSQAKKKSCKIIIPIDCNVSTNFKGSATSKKQNEINKEEIILDIGPETVKKNE